MTVTVLALLLDRIETVFKAHKQFRELWHEFAHGGKMEFGTIRLFDMKGVEWKIKVRWRGDRQHYLKLKTIGQQRKTKFRAGTRKHIEKPWKYKALTLEEWQIFAVMGIDDTDQNTMDLRSDCSDACSELLNELVYERRLGMKPE